MISFSFLFFLCKYFIIDMEMCNSIEKKLYNPPTYIHKILPTCWWKRTNGKHISFRNQITLVAQCRINNFFLSFSVLNTFEWIKRSTFYWIFFFSNCLSKKNFSIKFNFEVDQYTMSDFRVPTSFNNKKKEIRKLFWLENLL